MKTDSNEASGALFDLYGADAPDYPVLLSVPHAGRDYSDAVLTRARVPHAALQRLEDRHADLLIARLLDRGYPAIVARTPRAVIDLNRDARDIDPRLVDIIPPGQPLVQSAKQRGGLGLFPRLLPRCGDLWRAPMSWEAARSHIETTHTPYHRALEEHLDRLQTEYGEVLLIDVHSMPPLPVARGERRVDVVIGDRFGASAMGRLAEAARAAVASHGLVAALNHPYPGYYLLDRHGRPDKGRHALQIEISRDLYLDAALNEAGPGLRHIQSMLVDLVERLGQELIRGSWSEAAE
tara:strand:- start:62434 stop:63315 length:882 start_codon:yes stop_codon:yes gene_type:complete